MRRVPTLYNMCTTSRRTASLVTAITVLLLCLSVLSTFVTAKMTVDITDSVTLSGQTIDGSVYSLRSMTTSSNASLNYVTDCTIKGEGLGFSGFFSAVSDYRIPLFNLTMTRSTVTNATIAVTGHYPHYSTLTISHTTATMSGSTPLFDFTNLNMAHHVVVYVLDTTATWNADGSGGDVLRVGGLARQLFTDYSGFYMVNVRATNAAHMMRQPAPTCEGQRDSCLDLDNGLIAIDNAACINCTGSFLQSDMSRTFINGLSTDVLRISNCTSTGGQPFIHAAGGYAVNFGYSGNLLIYGITADGSFFSPSSKLIRVGKTTLMSFMHINVPSLGASTNIPVGIESCCTSWMGNITINSVRMTTLMMLTNSKLLAHYLVDPFGKMIAKAGSPTVVESFTAAASVFCVRPHFTHSSWERLNGWQRARCHCNSTGYGPYCMPIYDPVRYYASYASPSTTCTAPHCILCPSDQPQTCFTCANGYALNTTTSQCVSKPVCSGNERTSLDGLSCIPMTCQVANCDVCVAERDTVCQTCASGYNLSQDKKSCRQMVCQVSNCANCAMNTEDKCETCATDYKLSSDRKSCRQMVCQVGNCVKCVTNTEDQCQTCATNYKLSSDKKSCTEI
ncbi:surface antigen [Strigomonas culicis]|uniref:Surface antigen n=1 Tax=Strigomonas culicis TaxID=28005 RepID=S9TZX1_9TRYP|nr:surface antigen [Strigomonas culicis]|eukprot:EPY22139.1 surface antigen [Strigomonas culicis]